MNTPPPPASLDIVILNFNAGNRVVDCVKSAVGIPAVQQILVADNGSTDGSLEKLHALAAQHPSIRIMENGENLGFAKGNNRALPFLLAPYTLFLNPDTLITEEAVNRMLDHMEQHPDTGMAGPLILNEDGTEQRGCRRDDPTPARALKTFLGKRDSGINQTGSPLPRSAQEVDAISGAFMLVRREALEDVGPMDEGYFLHCEDLDWCKRFRDKGWKVVFVPDAQVEHYKGGSSRGRPIRVEWHKHKGMVRYYRKFYKDQYPTTMMWLVYLAVWARFFLLTPVWALKRLF